jgi:hypothetical protein
MSNSKKDHQVLLKLGRQFFAENEHPADISSPEIKGLSEQAAALPMLKQYQLIPMDAMLIAGAWHRVIAENLFRIDPMILQIWIVLR